MKRWFPSVYVLLAAYLALARASDEGVVWRQYYSPELTVYAANLRAAGAPKPVVELLISQAVNAKFGDREAALQPSLASVQSLREQFSPERREALWALRLEKNQELRGALGYVPEDTAKHDWPVGVMSRLAPAERDAVRHIADDYAQMIVKVISAAHAYLLADDRAKIEYLESQRSLDLGHYFTADEILDYELLETGYGKAFRSRLQLMSPTQDELRTYLSVAKKYDYHLANDDANTARTLEARAATNAELGTIWTPERYAEYRRAISASYKAIVRLTERLRLQPAVANEVFESQKVTTETGWKLFAGLQSVHPQARGQSLYGRSIIYLPSSTFGSPQASVVRTQIQSLITGHVAFVKLKLGEDGYAEYAKTFADTISTMQQGGASRLDYSVD